MKLKNPRPLLTKFFFISQSPLRPAALRHEPRPDAVRARPCQSHRPQLRQTHLRRQRHLQLREGARASRELHGGGFRPVHVRPGRGAGMQRRRRGFEADPLVHVSRVGARAPAARGGEEEEGRTGGDADVL